MKKKRFLEIPQIVRLSGMDNSNKHASHGIYQSFCFWITRGIKQLNDVPVRLIRVCSLHGRAYVILADPEHVYGAKQILILGLQNVTSHVLY